MTLDRRRVAEAAGKSRSAPWRLVEKIDEADATLTATPQEKKARKPKKTKSSRRAAR